MNFKKLFEKAKTAGLQDLEIYHRQTSGFSLQLFNKNIEKVNNSNTDAAAFRCIYNNKMGYVSSENLKDEKIDFIIEKLKENASSITSEDKVFIFPGSKEYQNIKEEYDDFSSIPVNKKIALVNELSEKIFQFDKRVATAQISYSENKAKVNLMNSKGLDLKKEYSYAVVSTEVVVKEDDENKPNYEYQFVKKFADFNIDEVAKKLVERALMKLKPQKVKTGSYKVVFENDTFASLLSAFSGIFSGEAIMRNLSCLKDKLNTKIGNELVTIIDNPLSKKGNFVQTFDDEGVATMNKTVVEQGTLKTYLHNLKTAAFFNTESTGNGFKSGLDTAVVAIPQNFYLEEKNDSFTDILKKCNNGIYVTELAGLHAGLSQISGTFNLQSSGFVIRDGKLAEPVTLFVTSGNILEIFNNITAIGNDLVFNFNSIGSPTVLVESLSIAGE